MNYLGSSALLTFFYFWENVVWSVGQQVCRIRFTLVNGNRMGIAENYYSTDSSVPACHQTRPVIRRGDSFPIVTCRRLTGLGNFAPPRGRFSLLPNRSSAHGATWCRRPMIAMTTTMILNRDRF